MNNRCKSVRGIRKMILDYESGWSEQEKMVRWRGIKKVGGEKIV